jgi:hypothetical protein
MQLLAFTNMAGVQCIVAYRTLVNINKGIKQLVYK